MPELLRLIRLEWRLRQRQPSLPLTALLMVVFTAFYLPPAGANYETLSIAGQRGAYNAHWVGLIVAVLGSLAFSLPAFLMVRGTFTRDMRARVWPLLEVSPLRPLLLLLSRWLSGTLFLWSLWGLVALTSLPLLLLRGEAPALDPASLLLPTVLITFPALALVSALAALFDALPRLAGLLGSVAYFALWTCLVMLSIAGPATWPDPLGVRAPLLQAAQVVAAPAAPLLALTDVKLNVGFVPSSPALAPASQSAPVWNGPVWSAGDVAQRLLTLALAAAGVGLAALVFRAPRPDHRPTVVSRPALAWRLRLTARLGAPWQRAALTEWTLAWQGLPRWLPWLTLALWCAAWGTPQADPLLLIVTVPVMVRLITLARQSHLKVLLDTAPLAGPLLIWRALAALTLLALPISSAVLRHLATQQPGAALALLAAVVLVTALVFWQDSLGVQSVNIEVGLLLLWYVGPFSGFAALNYASEDAWPITLLLALALGLIVLLQRRRQLQGRSRPTGLVWIKEKTP